MTTELPPRPAPPKRMGDSVQAWLAWFGLARLIVSALCVLVVAAGVAWLVRTPAEATESGLPFVTGSVPPDASTVPTLPTPPTDPHPTTTVPANEPVLVHVAGAVRSSGVYQLEPWERVHAAIEAAGGPSASADLDGLNLAAGVSDGQRIYVPEAGEVDPATVPSGGTPGVIAESEQDDVLADGPIDVNNASAAQLEALPGVGPATAQAIIEDRERHGPFASVADLERVPGIGPAKLARIADAVTA